jgi:hypothetical protein
MGSRIDNYNYGVNPKRVEEDFTYKKPDMISQETGIFHRLEEIEGHVKGILSGETVSVIQYPFYHAFAKELYRVQTRYGGGSACIAEAEILVVKWTARGLTKATLGKIRDEVFGIPPPVAP